MFSNVYKNECGILNLSDTSILDFKGVNVMASKYKANIRKMKRRFKKMGVILQEENISEMLEWTGFPIDLVCKLESLEKMKEDMDNSDIMVKVLNQCFYKEIKNYMKNYGEDIDVCKWRNEVQVNAKYKLVAKKVKPIAIQLSNDSKDVFKEARKEPGLRNYKTIGHEFNEEIRGKLQIGGGEFLNEPEKCLFQDMLLKYGKAFASKPSEIGCVYPNEIAPMVIFTVPHIPWDLKSILVPRALLPKLIELLKEKMEMGIIKPSIGPYSNRWFMVPKKSGALRFI